MGDRFFIEAGGHRLEAQWFGPEQSALAVVLLHEGLGCVSTWHDFPQRVAERTGARVLAYSRWGYGASDPVVPPRPLTYMHDEAAVVPEVLEQCATGPCVLVGHSDGASIALMARSPLIRGLVLMAPHVFCEDISVQSIAAARDAFERGDLRVRLEKHHGSNVDGAFWGWNRAWLDPEFRKWNLEEFLPSVTVPVTVVQGREDPYGTIAQVDAIQRGVKGKFTRRLFDTCGHAPWRDQPVLTLEAIAETLRSP